MSDKGEVFAAKRKLAGSAKDTARAKKFQKVANGKADQPESRLDAQTKLQTEETGRLRERCYTSGVVCKAKRVDADSSDAGLPAKADGMDVYKRSSLRKNRYLLNIPARLEGISGGKMGELAQLDTQNPVLYLDFPEGRVKLRGTMLFPKTKYLAIRFGQSQALCEDVFETMIVFPEYYWIGKKGDNPEEQPLPMPTTLQQAQPAVVKGSQQKAKSTQQDTQDTQEDASQPVLSLRQSQRTVKKRRYAELGSDDESGSNDSSPADSRSEEEPRATQTTGPEQRKKSGPKSTLLNFFQPQLTAGNAREASAGTPERSGGGGEEAPIPLSGGSSEKRSQPKRAARARLPIVLEGSDEDGSDGDSSESGSSPPDSDFSE